MSMSGGGSMVLLVYHKDANTNIKIWDRTKDTCIVQEFKNGDKSKKATPKIKYYNDKPFVICKGHRYYLDDFTKIEI